MINDEPLRRPGASAVIRICLATDPPRVLRSGAAKALSRGAGRLRWLLQGQNTELTRLFVADKLLSKRRRAWTQTSEHPFDTVVGDPSRDRDRQVASEEVVK